MPILSSCATQLFKKKTGINIDKANKRSAQKLRAALNEVGGDE